ncbi:MAG: hypothetical protein KKF26_01105 [Chloroflexi bacterium]|nr:hypothetical protein [Chloroflexota bacterium]
MKVDDVWAWALAPGGIRVPGIEITRMGSYFPFPIRNILVPHTGQTPWVAGLPFFIVIALASFISLWHGI